MQTVYQVGGLYISKDMIFGWCVAQDDIQYLPLHLLDLVTISKLESFSLPVYVPKDFSEALQEAKIKIADREKTFKWNQQLRELNKQVQVMAGEIKKLDRSLVRSLDRVNLVAQIVENMVIHEGDIFVSDLGYVKILGTNDEYFLVKNGERMRDNFELPITFDEAVDTILRKWW